MSKSNITQAATGGNRYDLKGRVAIVTGAGRGIGKAIAESLALQGAAVAICARSQSQLEATERMLKERGAQCFAGVCDVQSEAAIETFIDKTKKQFGKIDILVNNAGIYKTEPVASQQLSSWSEILNINLTGAMLFCRSVVKEMLASGNGHGRIINISSVSGRTGEIWASAYSASKFGLVGLTQSLALEVANKGITVNAVCPGWVSTEMAQEQFDDPEWCKLNGLDPATAKENACFGVPQNRFIEPYEVAELVCFLASDAAKGITGQSLNICGGLCIQ